MNKSCWQNRIPLRKFPALDEDLEAEALIIGGGITGVTTAYLLQREGVDAVLVERGACTQGETARTTAHLTYATDARLQRLVHDFGKNNAQAAWDAGRAALEKIHAIQHEENIDCDFRWTPGYLHSPWDGDDDSTSLQNDCDL